MEVVVEVVGVGGGLGTGSSFAAGSHVTYNILTFIIILYYYLLFSEEGEECLMEGLLYLRMSPCHALCVWAGVFSTAFLIWESFPHPLQHLVPLQPRVSLISSSIIFFCLPHIMPCLQHLCCMCNVSPHLSERRRGVKEGRKDVEGR